MTDDEFSILLRERRRRAECEAAGVAYIPDVQAARKAPHCDPETPTVPDVLLAPNAAPTPPVVDRILPPPLLISSPSVTVVCDQGVGTATSAAGESSIDLYLDDIQEITRSALYLTADKHAALQAALDAHLELLAASPGYAPVFDAAIMVASGLEAAAAAGLRRKALELRGGIAGDGSLTGLYALAHLTATTRLVCVFTSAPVWVVCSGSSATGVDVLLEAPIPLPPSDLYRTRPAAFRSSTVSVADANEQATLDAAADPTFSCVYVNAQVTASCIEDVGSEFDYGFDPAYPDRGSSFTTLESLGATRQWSGGVPATTTPGFSSYSLDSLASPRTLVTRVVVTAGQFSAGSQAAADAKARDAGVQFLDCFFPSRASVVDCANRDAATSNPVVARINELGVGNSLSFEARRNAVFAEMDEDFLGDVANVTNYGVVPPGVGETLATIDDSEGLRVELPAGMMHSSTSLADANEEARNHALGLLSCFWVSPEVTCSCVDDEQLVPVPGSFLFTRVTLDSLLVNYTSSLGSGKLTFLKGELGRSEDDVLDVASTMALCKVSLVCNFCNQTIAPRCDIVYGPGGVTSSAWTPANDSSLPLQLSSTDGVSSGISAGLPAGLICDSNPENVNTLALATASLPPLVNDSPGVARCRYGNVAVTKTCVQKAGANAFGLTPDASELSITIAAGSFEAGSQPESDEIASNFALAALVCAYGNPPMKVLCGASTADNTIDAGEYSGPPDVYGDGQGAAAASVGSTTNFLTIAAHAYTSLESPLDAKSKALSALISQLDCFWNSPLVTLYCGAPKIMPPAAGSIADSGEIAYGGNLQFPPAEPYGTSTFSVLSNGTAPGALAAAPIILAPASIVSYTSQADANFQAYAMAVAQFDCFFRSPPIRAWCAPVQALPTSLRSTSGEVLEIYTGNVSGPVVGEITLAAGAEISYISQAEATTRAYDNAVGQVECGSPAKHAFMVATRPGGGGGGGGPTDCCSAVDEIAIESDADSFKLYSPDPSIPSMLSATPGYVARDITNDATGRRCDSPTWIYLEANVSVFSGDAWALYRVGAAADEVQIKAYATEQNLLVGTVGDYTKVRRLIAKTEAVGADGSPGMVRNPCAGTTVVQMVTTRQKLSTSQVNGSFIPVITDFDTVEGGGGAATELLGSFCRQYVIGAGLAGAGDTYLQGGTITGSNGGSEVLADFKVVDAADTAPLEDSGDRLWLVCNVTATIANGVVQPGVALNSAGFTQGASAPASHVFSTSALTGDLVREVGRWTDSEFLPSGACGLSAVSGCPGGFAIR